MVHSTLKTIIYILHLFSGWFPEKIVTLTFWSPRMRHNQDNLVINWRMWQVLVLLGSYSESSLSPCVTSYKRCSHKNSDSSTTWTEVVCYVFIGTPPRYIWFVSSTDLSSSQFIIQYDQGLFICSFVLTLIPTKLSRTTNMLH